MSRGARRALLAAGLVLALGVSGLMCRRVGQRGRYALAYSTYGAGPEGTRGLFLLAAREGATPRRWTEDLGRLPAGAMLVALGGCDHVASRSLARAEQEAMVRWIEEGGTLVVAGATNYLPPELGVSLIEPSEQECLAEAGLIGIVLRAARRTAEQDAGMPDAEPPALALPDPVDLGRNVRQSGFGSGELDRGGELPEPRWATGRAPPLLGVPPIGLRRTARIVLEPGRGSFTTLLAIDEEPVAVGRSWGRGRIVVIASASAFQNRDLVSSGGAILFSRLLREHGGGTVLFDEYHLGAGARRGASRWIAERGLAPFFLQLGLIAAVFLWWRGVRFGAPRRELPPDPASTASYVSALGTLFEKSGDPAGAIAILAQHALATIAAHHHLDAREPARLAAELSRRNRREAAEAVEAIAAIARTPSRHPAHAARAIDDAVARATART